MFKVIAAWFRRYFSDPEAVLLLVLLTVGTLVILTSGKILAPVLTAIVLAYLLDWLAKQLQRLHVPRMAAVLIVYFFFIGLLVLLLLVALPAMWQQALALFNELPVMITRTRDLLLVLPDAYPSYFSQEQVNEYIVMVREAYRTLDVGQVSRFLVTTSLSTIPGFITLVIYLILIPLLIFFFLKDRELITQWCNSFLPKKRHLISNVWGDMNAQLGNYIRGKVAEITIVGFVTYAVFSFMGLQYSPLLSLLVGLSVLIPYIGAAIVTLPIAVVGFFQWGLSSEFLYLMIAYAVIQALDGNVLVPLLFSEVVDLHPVAIIVAVVFFGGLWGFWGVFFAIPLAILVKVVLTAWPRQKGGPARTLVPSPK